MAETEENSSEQEVTEVVENSHEQEAIAVNENPHEQEVTDADENSHEQEVTEVVKHYHKQEVAELVDDSHDQELVQDKDSGVGAEPTGEKRWSGRPGDSVFRMLIPAQTVASLIGRKGETVRRMHEESKACIKVLEAPSGVIERVVIIFAKEEPDNPISPVMDALLRVHKHIVDGLDGEPTESNPDSTVVTRILVPISQAANLVGKQGSTIKSIEEASNAAVRVLDGDLPPVALKEDKVVRIWGPPAGVHKALKLVASYLRKYLVHRSVIPLFGAHMPMPISHIDMPLPHYWDNPEGPLHTAGQGYHSGYAGHLQYAPPLTDTYYSGREHPPMGKPPHLGISAYGREVTPPMGVHPSAAVKKHLHYLISAYGREAPPLMGAHQPAAMGKPPHHDISAYRREAPPPMGAHPSASHSRPITSQVTRKVQVPISYAEAVIGPSGERIDYIRRASRATIKIRETSGLPGEMSVEITASAATDVQTAEQLIKNFMAEAAAASPDHNYNSIPSYLPAPTSPAVNTIPSFRTSG